MTPANMLDINLTTYEYKLVDITDEYNSYLGGTGYGTNLLLKSNADQVEPLAEESSVIFTIGPFSAVYPIATKTVALFRSPLTGNLGESHAGGRLAMAMYGAGVRAIRITGKSKDPCFIIIENEKVEFKRAYSVWGASSLAAERILRDHVPSSYKRSIIRIGPAGERLSPLACVTVDTARHFGRLGLGAVLGSKNLKAIVISGDRYSPVPNLAKYNSVYNKIFDLAVKSELMKKYHNLGTAMNVVPLNEINSLPTRNFSQGYFESAKAISGESFAERYLAQHTACAHCPVGCIHLATLREPYSNMQHHYKCFKISYDHELIYALGSNLSIANPEHLLHLLLFIEKQGWDVISIGVTLAWAIEAFQNGYINTTHTDGLVLNFGDAETIYKAVNKIANNTNEFYRDLEKGVNFCSNKYGGTEFAIHFGKNEAPGYMTGLFAYLGYATGVRHSHLDSAGYSIDQKNLIEPKELEHNVKELYKESLWRNILNSLVICLFARNIYTSDLILEALDAIDIKNWTYEKLLELAKEINKNKIIFKQKCGFKFEELAIPKKLTKVVSGNNIVSPDTFSIALEIYKSLVFNDMQKSYKPN